MRNGTALIILDMFNTFEFPEADKIIKPSLQIAKSIKKLKSRMKLKGYPVIYVNDNFGNWKDDWKKIYDRAAALKSKGKDIANILKPETSDYFILKPKHSAFYATPLEILLNKLKCKNLILTGIAGNICVLFTAHDAHMRNYKIHVPKDCIACSDSSMLRHTIAQLEVFNIGTHSYRLIK